MIKIENVEVFGWEAAIRGMRNPMNSWKLSDSVQGQGGYFVGEADLGLMKRLVSAGSDHGKFMRFIGVTVDLTAPLYWWKEFDTYKVGTVANSCSTMHKIHAKEFTIDDFSCEHLMTGCEGADVIKSYIAVREHDGVSCLWSTFYVLNTVIEALNVNRKAYLETKDKKYWWQMIQLLPTSYNQKRTILLNYEVLRHMYRSRKNHKLDEWRNLCAWIETLPYSELITMEG